MSERTVYWDGQTLSVVRREPPPLKADEVRIKTRLGGICNTDLELMAGYKDFRGRLGHEFVGEVIEGPAEWLGRRVAGEINIVCGQCDMCQRGMPSQCRNRLALGIDGGEVDGAFADSFRLPARNLHRVPDNVSDEQAVFTEPLAAACRITELHPIGTQDKVVLIGAGKLGMLCAQVIKLTGADLTVIVRRDKQANLLAKWGIRSARLEDVPKGMADYVIESTGDEAGFNAALELVRPRGTIVLKSTFHGLTPANLTLAAVYEIRIEGSRCGPFAAALHLLSEGKVDVTSMIEGVYPLDEVVAAVAHARQRGVLKILLKP